MCLNARIRTLLAHMQPRATMRSRWAKLYVATAAIAGLSSVCVAQTTNSSGGSGNGNSTAAVSTTTTTATTAFPTTTKLCHPSDCFGESCDFWDSSPTLSYDCIVLEDTYGCDCGGCECAFTDFPIETTMATVAETTVPPVESTLPPTTTTAEPENVCSDGTVAKVCFVDMRPDELVALFALPAFWLIVLILVSLSDHIMECVAEAKAKRQKKANEVEMRRARAQGGGLPPQRKILEYSFSKVAKMTFLTHSRSWEAFRDRSYAEMEKVDFQGVPLSGFRSAMAYGFDLYSKWSGTALISSWRSAVQASCLAGLMLWVLYFLKQLQDWDILDGNNGTDDDALVTSLDNLIGSTGGGGGEDAGLAGLAAANATTTSAALSAALATVTSLLDSVTTPTSGASASNNTAAGAGASAGAGAGDDAIRYTTLWNVRAHIAAVAEMNDVIEEYVSFMLIFYTVLNVNNYLRCFQCAMQLQQSMENMALNFVTVYPDFQRTRRSKYQLYRYLNALHFLAYAYLIPEFVKESKQFPLYLGNVGLLTKDEVKQMENLNTPIATMRGWLVQVLQNDDLFASLATKTKNDADAARVRAFLVNCLASVIHNMQELKSATMLYPPLSFVQIMRLLMDVYLLIMPVVLVNTMYIAADPPLRIQIVPVLACFLLTLFYNGLMRLVVIIRNVRAVPCVFALFSGPPLCFADRVHLFLSLSLSLSLSCPCFCAVVVCISLSGTSSTISMCLELCSSWTRRSSPS